MSILTLLINTRAKCSYCAVGGVQRMAEWTNASYTRYACDSHKQLLPALSILDRTSLKQAA